MSGTTTEPAQEPRGEAAADFSYDRLRAMILDGTLAPDTLLSERELADRFEVSRTPVREALRRLQQDGLVEAVPGRRSRVFGIDVVDLEDVYVKRLLCESLAVVVSVPRLTADDIVAIEDSLEEMRTEMSGGDYAAWEAAHAMFHASIVVHASAPLKKSIAGYAARCDRYRRVYQHVSSRARTWSDAEHQAIMAACVARDPHEAVVQLARHFARTALGLIAQMVPEHNPHELRTALVMITGGDWSTDDLRLIDEPVGPPRNGPRRRRGSRPAEEIRASTQRQVRD